MRSKTLCISFVLLLSLALSSEARARTIGPDAFGYTATDAVPFAFEDIASTGTLTLAGTDDGVFTAPLGFTFGFYGVSYTSVSWSTNGLISFGGTNSQFSNGNLAVTRVIGDRPSIAVLWDDWRFLASVSEGCYYETRGVPGSRRFILQWSGAIGFDLASQTVTYQAILFEGSNAIVMQYLDVESGDLGSLGALATVGIRDTNGQVNGRNLVWSFNSGVLWNGLALRFSSSSDTDPPVVSIVTPLEGAVVGASPVLVAASVSDASATSVSSVPAGVSGSLPPAGGTISGGVALVEGPNTIAVSAVDAAGNSSGTSVTVHLDTTAPSILSVSPADGAVLGMSDATFVVDVSDLFPVTLTVAGLVQSIPAGGGLGSVPVSLVEGDNAVFISATDTAGNMTGLVVHVMLDSNSPVIAIDAPADGGIVGADGNPVPVVVTVNDISPVTVSSEPEGVSQSLPAGGGIAIGAVTLAEGSNAIVVTASDGLRAASATVTVVLDSTPPSLNIASPPHGAAVRGVIEVSAMALDPAPGCGVASVNLSLDGISAGTPGSAPFTWSIDTAGVADGMHTLSVTAVDCAGNAVSAAIQVLVDNTPPVVSFSSPDDGSEVSGTVPYQLEASDPASGIASLDVLVNGSAPSEAPAGVLEPPVPSLSFSGREDSTRWPDGELTFSAKVADAAGNETSSSIAVRASNSVPATVVITPPAGSIVSGTITIGVEVSGPEIALIELFVDGVPVGSAASSPLSVMFDTTSRLDGVMVIQAVAADAGERTWSASSEVVVDNLSLDIRPTVLELSSRGDPVKVLVMGSCSELILDRGRRLEVRIPGGSPVPALRARACDERVAILFDRSALVASLRAGIASGAIRAGSHTTLILAVDGHEIGSVRILPREKRCR